MAKRFTDTAKWDKAWFRRLSPKMKCTWEYITHRCDHAGVWEIDCDTLSFFIGEDVSLFEITECFGDKIRILESGKIHIPGFIEFQYGHLNPDNRVHKSVIQRLEKVGASKPLASPLEGAKDKDKDKDKEKDKDKDKEKSAVQSEEIKNCVFEWQKTREHFGISRPNNQRDEVEIAKAISRFGFDWVTLALLGARKQTKGKTFDPAQFVSLSIYLHPSRIERLVNIGAGKEAAEGIDWGAVFGKESA